MALRMKSISKVEYAPYCVQTAPLDEQKKEYSILFVGESYSANMRVTMYLVSDWALQLICFRKVQKLRNGKKGRLEGL